MPLVTAVITDLRWLMIVPTTLYCMLFYLCLTITSSYSLLELNGNFARLWSFSNAVVGAILPALHCNTGWIDTHGHSEPDKLWKSQTSRVPSSIDKRTGNEVACLGFAWHADHSNLFNLPKVSHKATSFLRFSWPSETTLPTVIIMIVDICPVD